MRLSAKISLLVIAAAVAAGVGVALVDFGRASREMQHAAEDKLLAVVQARTAAISDYLGGIQRDLRLQGTSPFLIAALTQFTEAHAGLGPDANAVLRATYGGGGEPKREAGPTAASAYEMAHDAVHPTLRSFVDRAGYDDLLLLDRDGNVLHSVRKRGDFATNVASEQTGLGQAFREAEAAMATSRQVFVDFRPYPHVDEAPTAFAAVVVQDDTRQPIGFVCLAMSIARIDEVMGAAGGLSETGETLLLGADMTIRGSSRLAGIWGETISIPALDAVLTTETEGAGIALTGEQRADAPAVDVLVAYQVLDFLGTRWIVVAKSDLDDIHAPIRAMRNIAIASSVGIALLVALGALLLAQIIIVRPMNEVVRGLRTLTEGDRRAPLELQPRKDEIGDIGRALSLYRTSLAERDRLDAETQREAALLEIARRFRVIAEAQPHPVLVIDRAQRTIRYANPAAALLLQFSLEEADMPRQLDDFLGRTEAEALVAGMAEHADAEPTVRLRRADGSSVAMSFSARRLDYDGADSLVIGLVDLTEREMAQAEIARQRERIHQGEKLAALGSLLAGVAHELNNPLSIVVGQSMMFEDLSTDPEVVARGTKIRLAAERCARIVRTFLSMARQRPVVRTAVDLNDAVIDAVDLLGYALRTSAITLDFDLADPLPTIHADADQIGQVIANLVVNAQQAMVNWPGERRLRISTASDQRVGMVRLAVADSGPGVPAAIRSRIFEPFFTTKPIGDGTGIGLSISHGIVAAHGGMLEVEDTPGGGATFVIHLPTGEGDAAAPDRDARSLADPVGVRALVVDDETDVAETLAAMLVRAGIGVTTVAGAQDGLKRLEAEGYDIVFSDVRMPGTDGIAFFRAIVERWPALGRRFVVVTGDMMSASTHRFIEENGIASIEKPFTPADVLRVVGDVFSRDPSG